MMSFTINRRTFGCGSIAFTLALPACVDKVTKIVIHRDPGCGCCLEWADQLQMALNRPQERIENANRALLHAQFSMPQELASCHTAIIDGLAFEGHVPIADVQRLLLTTPAGVNGLAVPGMPNGSQGMENDAPKQNYTVYSFGSGTPSEFANY